MSAAADGAPATPRFEGSYMGADAKISARAVMECKICWTAYEPEAGDETRQIRPGTPFLALPQDWSCPNCGAPKEQFMVLSDPGRDEARPAPTPDWLTRAVAALKADFAEIHAAKMRDTPLVNRALAVAAVGFRPHGDGALGVLVTPWFMNLVLLPSPEDDWSGLSPGAKEVIAFPSGDYEVIHNARPSVGGYKACSLFSPMSEFASQQKALEVAEAIVPALLTPPAPPEPKPVAAPTRRALLTGGVKPAAAPESEPAS
jgi:[NiFe] hydrogenase assembly HybE family chaperone